MGQYYNAIVTKGHNQKVHIYNPHEYNSGAKLTEHGWFMNDMVFAVMLQLVNNPNRVAWIGDYSHVWAYEEIKKKGKYGEEEIIYKFVPNGTDNDPFTSLNWTTHLWNVQQSDEVATVLEGVTSMGGGFLRNTAEYMKYYNMCWGDKEHETDKFMVPHSKLFEKFDNEYWQLNSPKDKDGNPKSQKQINADKRKIKEGMQYVDAHYEVAKAGLMCFVLVNHTKKEYINLATWERTHKDKNGWVLNPLPLLTACGNGLGGGDYYGDDEKWVGTWAFDKLEVVQYTWNIHNFPEGYRNVSTTYRFFDNY